MNFAILYIYIYIYIYIYLKLSDSQHIEHYKANQFSAKSKHEAEIQVFSRFHPVL